MASIMMASIMVSIMASVMASVMASNNSEQTMAEIHSLMEIALKHAGGNGYCYVSGKEDFFKSLLISQVNCQRNAFLPSSKTYEERNELKGTEFQFRGDYTGSDSREEKMRDTAERLFNMTVMTIGCNDSASGCKKSESMLFMNSNTPPRSTLRRETGYDLYSCKYEFSLKINCGINFSNWRW